MGNLTEEQHQKILDTLQCDKCSNQLILAVYTTSREAKLLEALEETKSKYVCLAFANEGIAEIGPFTGSGCEAFDQQDDEFALIKERAKKSIHERIFKEEKDD